MTQNTINTSYRLNQFLYTSSNSVTNCDVVMRHDDAIPQKTDGNEILTLTITPISATSLLCISYFVTLKHGSGANSLALALFQDDIDDALAATYLRTQNTGFLRHNMVSGTTSATTFKIRIGPHTALTEIYVNGDTVGNRLMGGVSYTNLTIEEYI